MYQDPYAVKAYITSEFDTDHINIWITFPEPMNQKHKPSEAVWNVSADGTPVSVNSSAWQDAYTLLLVISSVGSKPDRITVAFDGPDGSLETTWLKNWEPFGPILSVDIGRFIEIDPLAMALLDQSVKYTSSPQFNGVSFGPDGGINKYKFEKVANAGVENMRLTSLVSGQRNTLDLLTVDADGTDYVVFRLVGKTGSGGVDVNDEKLVLQYAITRCNIFTSRSGSSLNILPLALFVLGHPNQFVLNIDGTINVESTIDAGTGYKCGGTSAAADGVYTTGYKLTPAGNNGTITIKGGIVVQITPAT